MKICKGCQFLVTAKDGCFLFGLTFKEMKKRNYEVNLTETTQLRYRLPPSIRLDLDGCPRKEYVNEK